MNVGCKPLRRLAHGLNQIYPESHKKYCEAIERNGGFLTEFWSTSNPDRENFLRRNRIIAGMSEGTIVIESADREVSCNRRDIANSYNRDVFAVPGRTNDPFSAGTNALLKTKRPNHTYIGGRSCLLS